MKRVLLACLVVLVFALSPLSSTVQPAGAQGSIIYVDSTRQTGANNGLSWENAYTSLQSALLGAVDGNQIWVAAGTYTPSADALGQPTTGRTATFFVPSGVAVYGGFAGNETSLAGRDWRANPTILSGDMLGDDSGPVDLANITRQENAYHVVTVYDAGDTTRLDGFIIQGGNANGTDPHHYGGGIYVELALARFVNLDLLNNTAINGGGMFTNEFSGSLTNIRFLGNSAQLGGGLYGARSPQQIQNAVFSGNQAEKGGGMMNELNSGSNVVNATFTGNTAVLAGAAVYNDQRSTLWAKNSIFAGAQSVVDAGSSRSHVLSSVVADAYIAWLQQVEALGGTKTGTVVEVDPRLANPAGIDTLVGTLDDDLTLLPGSPAEDKGDSNQLLMDAADLDADGDAYESTPLDLVGRYRHLGAQPDAGAYESLGLLPVTISGSAAYYGQDIELLVQVGSAFPAATGTVTIYNGTVAYPPITLDGNQQARLTIPTLNAGTHSFTARYSGDANYRPATSDAYQQVVHPMPVSVNASASPAASVVGQPVTLLANVQPLLTIQTTITGTVLIRDAQANTLCSYSIPEQTGCAYTFNTPGTYTFTAWFQSLTSNFVNTSSPAQTITVSMAASSVSITGVSPTEARAGQTVTVTYAAAITAPGSAPLTGEVTIASAEEPTATCSGPAPAGSCTIVFSIVAEHTLTAAYSGDTLVDGSVSPTRSYRVRGEDAYVDKAGMCAGNYPCFTTISAGIADVTDGHTVFVYPGVYDEDLTISNKKITVDLIESITLTGGIHIYSYSKVKLPSKRLVLGYEFVNSNGVVVPGGEVVLMDDASTERLEVGTLGSLTITDGKLFAYWPLDEGLGTQAQNFAFESSAHLALDAVSYAGEYAPLTFSRNALRFTGTEAPLSVALNVPESGMAVSFWFRTDQASTGLYEVANADYTAYDRSIFLKDGNICAYISGASAETICTTGEPVNDGSWHHVVHTFGSYYYGQRLFVDGAQRAAGARMQSDLTSQTRVILGGAKRSTGAELAIAVIDDVRLYKRILTPTEISALANGASTLKTVMMYKDMIFNGDLSLHYAALDTSAASRGIILKGDWLNSYGIFIPQRGTVWMSGENQSIEGSTTFYNLNKVGAGETLTFASGDLQTILGTLTLKGADGSPLTIDASGADNWKIDPRGAVALEYLHVSHSTNINSSRINATTGHNTPGAGNIGWNFYAPVLHPTFANVQEGTDKSFTLTASDADGDPVTLTISTLPAAGTLYHAGQDGGRGAEVLAGETVTDPNFIYAFDVYSVSQDNISLLASDGQVSVPVTFTLHLANVNDPPQAVDDNYTTDEDMPVIKFGLQGLLGNDTDEDGSQLTAKLDQGPENGDVQLQVDGTFVYTPRVNFNGTDTFTYTVSDGIATDTATVTITVNPVDDLPEPRLAGIVSSATEGEEVRFGVSLIDPDDGTPVDFSSDAVITWDFGDQTDSGFSVLRIFPDEAVYVVNAHIVEPLYSIDETLSTMIEIVNAAPQIESIAPIVMGERGWVTQVVTFDDPGVEDTWTVTVDYGDGSEVQSPAASGGQFEITHQYMTVGTYEITIVVADGDGGEDTLIVPVTVGSRFLLFVPFTMR